MTAVIRSMRIEDWPAVRAIYQEGIDSGQATFETSAPVWKVWNGSHRADCRIVAECKGVVVGWAALSPVSERCVYAGVAEVSVYVAQEAQGQGVGKALLRRLVDESEQVGIWTLQAGIFPENRASLTLHEKHGFHVVGRRERLGQLDGIWRDVLLLERRSSVVGG